MALPPSRAFIDHSRGNIAMLKKSVIAVAALAMPFSVVVTTAPSADAATGIYKNCTALHTKWKHGVGRAKAHDHTSGTPVTTFFHSTKQYNTAINKNSRLDADKDGIACEQK
jgi:hypothetical protein